MRSAAEEWNSLARLGEDISVENLILGQPSGESQDSFRRWLERRAGEIVISSNQNDLNMAREKLIGESLFERYLISQGMTAFEFEKAWDGIRKRPDYAVYHRDDVYVFDVKQFKNQTSIPSVGSFGMEPYARIREKINDVRSQFKYFKDKVCGLVLYTLDPFVRLREPSVILAAMYGDLGFTTLYDRLTGSAVPDSRRRAFLRNGKMLRYESGKPQNQTISAVITLRLIGQTNEVGVIVWENYFARRQFPRDVFCGSYDERWGRDGDSINRLFVGEGLLRYLSQQQ